MIKFVSYRPALTVCGPINHAYCHKTPKDPPWARKKPWIMISNMMHITTPVLCYLQVTELQIDVNDLSVGQATEEVEEDDDVGDFEGITEDTDEEYVPVAESSSFSPSTSTARKRKAQCKTDRTENGEAVEDESKKDSVQCPICDKSFKSKYYLKVHNRYTASVFVLEITVERAATNASFS